MDNCRVSSQLDSWLSTWFAWQPSFHLYQQSIQRSWVSKYSNDTLKHSLTMSHQRGTPRHGSSSRGRAQRDMSSRLEDGYDTGASILVRTLIDEWEAHLVTEHFARGIGGGHLNHCWTIKNMMGSLMEEMSTIEITLAVWFSF